MFCRTTVFEFLFVYSSIFRKPSSRLCFAFSLLPTSGWIPQMQQRCSVQPKHISLKHFCPLKWSWGNEFHTQNPSGLSTRSCLFPAKAALQTKLFKAALSVTHSSCLQPHHYGLKCFEVLLLHLCMACASSVQNGNFVEQVQDRLLRHHCTGRH